jgi:Bacterial membrane protein YfhO
VIIAGTLLVIGMAVGALWWRATSKPPIPHPTIYTGLAESSYWFWKLAFTVVTFTLLWWCLRLRTSRSVRQGLLAATIMLACFAEPAATVSCWWGRLLSLSAARLRIVSPTTRYLQQFPATNNRVYTRTELFAEEFNPHPRLESANLHALYGLHNLAGMEPLILERFSRALGGVGPDSVTPLPGFPANNDDIFSSRSHVLDLLNTTHVVSFANLKTFEDPLTYKDGIGLSVANLDVVLAPGATAQLTGSSRVADQLALVTSLANSVAEPQGTIVARIRLRTVSGQAVELNIRAGIDTSEWAHDRPDVRSVIKHERAPIFDSQPVDGANTFPANRYWARFALGARQQFTGIEIENVSQNASLAVWRASLYDSHTGLSSPLSLAARSSFWKTVYDSDQVQILHNERAMPRAWLVAEAEAVDGEEALQRIRGKSTHEFDPTRTALLEVLKAELPDLPGGPLAPGSKVRIVSYEPTHISYETDAPTATVLVSSEIFYPGWEATVDGNPMRIMLADFLLRGIPLSAGQHHVELRYRAPAARNGAIISVLTLLGIGGLLTSERRRRTPIQDSA